MKIACKKCGFRLIPVFDFDRGYVRNKCIRCEGGYAKYSGRKTPSPRFRISLPAKSVLATRISETLAIKANEIPYWKNSDRIRREKVTVKRRHTIIIPPIDSAVANSVWRALKQKIVRCNYVVQNAEKYKDNAVTLSELNVRHLTEFEVELRKLLDEEELRSRK